MDVPAVLESQSTMQSNIEHSIFRCNYITIIRFLLLSYFSAGYDSKRYRLEAVRVRRSSLLDELKGFIEYSFGVYVGQLDERIFHIGRKRTTPTHVYICFRQIRDKLLQKSNIYVPF